MNFLDEHQLKESLKSGNHKALAFLMNTYHQRLCTYAYSLSMDYELSKDIVQSVMVKIWENRNRVDKVYSIKSFLYRSVYNSLVDHWRSNNRILAIEARHLETLSTLVENEDEEKLKVQIKLVEVEIQNLPPRCKETFLLSKKDGLTNIEIAGVMNVSLRTVEGQINKAYNILRTKLADKVKPLLFLFSGPTLNPSRL